MADSFRAGPGWAEAKAHVNNKGKSSALEAVPDTEFF
jgi:hypothetical protein